MNTLDRMMVSITLALLMVLVGVVPFLTADLVLRGLPERRECTCSVGLIHDGLKPSDTPTFTNMTLPRIENGLPIGGAPGGVTTHTGPIFATNMLKLPDADVGARPEIWIASTNNTMRRVQFTNVNSPVSSLRPIDASLRPSVVGESFRDIIQTNRVVLTLEADGRITYEKIPLKPR